MYDVLDFTNSCSALGRWPSPAKTSDDVGVGIAGPCHGCRCEHGVAVVRRGAVEQNIESSGSVAAYLEIEIKCGARGEVVKQPFDISDAILNSA